MIFTAIQEVMMATTTATNTEALNLAKQYLEDRLKGTTISQVEITEQEDFKIPIIDLGAEREIVAKQIRSACLNSGFFYITSHGVSPSAREDILNEAGNFFKSLPLEKKQALHLKNSRYGYGWEPSESTSIYGDVETKEAFNWSYQEDLDFTGGDGKHVQLDGSKSKNVNQWPEGEDLPDFYPALREYYGQALQLGRTIWELFALSLDLEEGYFDDMLGHPSVNGRLMYYPPVNTAREVEGIGLGAHSDYQCFTILLTSSTPGLEILSPTGRWITAPAVEDALVVNVGDMMMRWTNGLYRSTVHRVVNRGREERVSVPLFFGPNNDGVVEVLPSCVSEGRPALYAPITAGEYVLHRLEATKTTAK